MNKKDIICMAEASGVEDSLLYEHWRCNVESMTQFAKLVAQHEREACAKVCEDQADDGTEGEWDGCCLSLAKKIRARGQE